MTNSGKPSFAPKEYKVLVQQINHANEQITKLFDVMISITRRIERLETLVAMMNEEDEV